jgi:predicted ATPase/DNA-binding CsgD family transcriptional regulator
VREHGRLPAETTGFVGREAELARLDSLLASARLVTVTGPGGVGKTRLAVRAAAQAAARFPDGARIAELSPLRDPELLPQAVANALGLPEVAQSAGLEAVLGHLRHRGMLLILDTCEHLIEACALLAEAIMAHAPGVTVLATSREPLDVSGETSCPLAPLPVPALTAAAELWARHSHSADRAPPHTQGETFAGPPDSAAVDLFLQRAATAVPGFSIGPDDLPDVIRLCRRLDGVPLALELAALRLRTLPLAELVSRVGRRMGILARAYLGSRHQTLRDTIGWSYDLCTPAERATWARLSLFEGPFSLAAAEEVCAGYADAGPVLPAIIRLVDKSVLLRIEPTDGDGPRYRMLDTVREFGAEQLAADADAAAAKDQFVAHYLTMAADFSDHFLEDEGLDRLREMRGEHDNLRVALECALEAGGQARSGDEPGSADEPRAADGVALAIALFAYWRTRGLAVEGSRWLAAAAARAPADSPARAHSVLARGYLTALRGGAAQALADASEVLRLGDLLGDKLLTARGQLLRNLALRVAGRLAEATEAGAAALRQLTVLDDRPGLIALHTQLSCLALVSGDTAGALGSIERGLRLIGGARDRWVKADLHVLAALALCVAGRDIEATRAAAHALRVKHEAGDDLGVAFTLEVYGWLAARAGRHDRCAWLLGAADARWASAGGRPAAAAPFGRLHAAAVVAASDALGDKRFAELFSRGTLHPFTELLGYTTGASGPPGQDAGARARLPGQLTAREQEIATLVAEGLSNRQIAERLFISRRTVDAHIEHIFGKLGITSRVVLTRWLRGSPGSPPNA